MVEKIYNGFENGENRICKQINTIMFASKIITDITHDRKFETYVKTRHHQVAIPTDF